MKLKRLDNNEVIYELDCNSLKELVERALKDKIDFYMADLRYADLSGVNFNSANFSGVNFNSANFSGADLSYTNLSFSNFSGVNFNSANFRGAKLFGVNLRNADLTGANLTGTDLTGADLRHTNLANAIGIDYFKEYDLYAYKSYVLVQNGKEPIIKIGCYSRTIKEWENDFWNNDIEFPNDNSRESIKRFECYQTMLKDYNEKDK